MEALPPGEPVYEVAQEVEIHKGSTDEVSTNQERPVAVLWLPDPEQYHGWREHYVKKAAPKPNGKPMGYRRK